MNRELYLTLVLFAVTVLAVWGFLLVLSPFLVSIAWALCLAAITFGLYRRLNTRWRRPRLAALSMVLLTAVVILVPLGVIFFLAGEELVRLGESGILQWVKNFETSAPDAYRWLDQALANLGLEGIERTAAIVADKAPDVLWRPVAKGAWDVLGAFFTTVMGLIIMFATQYFVYTEGPRLTAWLRSLLPLPSEDVDRVLTTLSTTTSAAVIGGLFVALFQGFLGGLGYAWVGIQAPVLWGMVTAIFSLLPVGGAALVWGPIAIYLFAVGDVGKGWLMLLWGGIAVSGADNVFRPWVLRRTGSRVHPMLLFFAILSGIGLFGVSGVVFGPLLIAFLMTLAQIYREHMGGGSADTASA